MVAIMQPYFLPYIGYFQLIAAAELFVVYDNIQYTKKGWVNRNRFLRDGEAVTFSIPLKGDSDYLDVRDRELASSFSPDKVLALLTSAYRRAPQFSLTMPLLERILRFDERHLFEFVEHSIVAICAHLAIQTEIRRSSNVAIDHAERGQDKVLSICQAVGAGTYVNAIGGMELYSRDAFEARGIDLKFIRTAPIRYEQFAADFVPWLSIVDVLMFNPIDQVQEWVQTAYELV